MADGAAVARGEEADMISAEVMEAIHGIDWDFFDSFTYLGSLEALVPCVRGSSCRASLESLGSIHARMKGYRSDNRKSLHVYLALSVTEDDDATEITALQLLNFYKHVFFSDTREKNMHAFFQKHATIMIIRHTYYLKQKYRLEIIGALTFSRPIDRVPTYLAYVAVSNGRQGLPSLSDKAMQSIPPGSFAVEDKLEGYRGRGLTTLMICLMEVLVTTSVRVEHDELPRRIPLPECFLHYNTNNEDSSAGWLRHGFSPLLGTTESLDDDIATVRVRYERLVVALHGCMIFRASHLDEKHSATMYKKFQFQVEDHASVLPPPPDLRE